MGYKTPTIYEILSANIRSLILVDLTQILSVVQAVFVLTPNLRITPRNLARHIMQRVCEGQTYGRRKDAAGDCCGDVLPRARSTLASWQVAGDFAARFSAGSCKALQCRQPVLSCIPTQCPGFIRQKRSTSVPTGNLQTQLQPRDRQLGCTCRALRR